MLSAPEKKVYFIQLTLLRCKVLVGIGHLLQSGHVGLGENKVIGSSLSLEKFIKKVLESPVACIITTIRSSI